MDNSKRHAAPFYSRTTRYASRIVFVAALLLTLSACDKDSDRSTSEPYQPAYVPPTTTPPIYYSNAPSMPPPVVMPSTAPSTVAPMPSVPGTPEIRVAVFKDVSSIRVGAPLSGARIVLNGQPWRQLPPGSAINVTHAGTALLLEGQPVNSASVRFETFSPDAFIKLNDRDVSACVVLSRPVKRTGILAVAQLSLEDYLAGVLAGEVPYERWHPEALKAQAVVSRTYALYEVRAHVGEAFDVESTVMSQVFKGGYKNIPTLSLAINATHGQVLTSSGTVFPAFFHSTCGGRTDAAAGIFPEHAGVKALCGTTCPHCTASPGYRWTAKFSKETIAQKLRTQIPTMGKIESITFADAKGAPVGNSPTDMHRVQTVTIKHSGGTNQMQGNAFRLAVSPKDLKSLLFGQVTDRGDMLEINGGGFGHGVGLCQYGSQGMATSGQTYTSILGFYYPGAALTRMY